MEDVIFDGKRFALELRRYGNGRPGLVLVDPRDSQSYIVASVNLPDVPAATDEIFIKDYAENEGMLATLEEAGVVRATGERIASGFVTFPRAKLLPEFLARIGGEAQETSRASPTRAESLNAYQIWLNENSPVERIYQMFGIHMAEFPNGFRHVADVVASNVGEAFRKAHSDGNELDPNDTSWKDWQRNEGVSVLVPDVRGADFGDVVVSPDDQPHQLVNGGFRSVPWTPPRGRHAARADPEVASTSDAPSPSAIAGDNRPEIPSLSTGRTKGKKP